MRKRTRRIGPLVAALLLLAGCVGRPVSAPAPKETAAPATAEPTPSPEPTPEPTPTPCPHLRWENGTCADCGAVCAHEIWGEGVCLRCGTACGHPDHDGESRRCSRCGAPVPHTYRNGQCTLCGAAPVFLTEILPRSLFVSSDRPGRLETLSYMAGDYRDLPGREPTQFRKEMVVYLPYGYDPAKKYDLLVLVHGMGCTERYWLAEPQDYHYPDEDYVYTTDLLDSMIADGRCREMIVATPCFYRDSGNLGNYYRIVDEKQFLFEMREYILPLLLQTYSTWADEPTLEGMAAQREHFAYAGLSMGSIYAFTSFIPECLDIFSWFGCFSGSDGYTNRLARAIDGAAAAGRPMYYFYNSIGTKDTMLYGHRAQYKEVLAMAESLNEGENAAFNEIRDARHTYEAWGTGLYNFLPVVFSLPPEAPGGRDEPDGQAESGGMQEDPDSEEVGNG